MALFGLELASLRKLAEMLLDFVFAVVSSL